MKRLLTIFMILFSVGAKAQDASSHRFTYGAEWGYVAVFYSGYHYNFFDPEGFRADIRDNGLKLENNAEVYLHCGYNLNAKTNLSVYFGYSAIEDYHNTVPISLRLTRYFDFNRYNDRWFTYIDIGSGISLKHDPQEILTGKIGCGYRMALSQNTSLDFIAAIRCAYTHPDITYYGENIPHSNINRNNAYASALSLGMALTF